MARYLHALTQMTISPNLAKGGTKVNVVPGEAVLYVDIRLLPGQDEVYAHVQIRKTLGNLADDTTIERIPDNEGGGMFLGTASDIVSPLVHIMSEVVREIKGPDTILVPLMATGGTDARLFRKAFGTQAYGFAVSDDTLDLQTTQSLFHGDDERIAVGTIDLTAKAYYAVAKRFLS